MKIVQVCGYYPPHVGGLEFCAKHIAEQLAQDGHDVTVLTSNVGAGQSRSERAGKLHVRYLRGFEFAHTPFVFSLSFVLARLSRDSLLHIHLSHVTMELAVWAVAKLRRMPYVAHFHMDVDVSGPFGFLFKAYKKTLLPVVIRGAAKVITLSEEQRQLVTSRYRVRPEAVEVIPNGVGQAFFATTPKVYPRPVTKLLFTGRFALQKNIPRLVRAVARMKSPVELHLVGDGEKRPEIEALITKLGLKNVTLHGKLSGADLIAAYHAADIFVMPSDREGMPLVLLEAMAAGLPVVASSVQGLREFVADNGVLVTNPSPETFAQALDELIATPQTLADLSQRSTTFARGHAWPSLVARIEQLYKEARHVA